MPDSDDHEIPQEQEKLGELLTKIVAYQRSLPDGRAVELDELRREGVLAPDDVEFLNSHSVTYKPHRLSDFHGLDMFHLPSAEGGSVFIGPGGPPLTKRRAPLRDFQSIVETFLEFPRPRDELLLHIEFTEDDGMGVSPEMICFTLRSGPWRGRLAALRAVATEFGLHPVQDEEIQGGWLLSFSVSPDAGRTATAAVALLNRGCGLMDETEVIYSAGALDEG